jgi:hypothetical protein
LFICSSFFFFFVFCFFVVYCLLKYKKGNLVIESSAIYSSTTIKMTVTENTFAYSTQTALQFQATGSVASSF